MRRILNAFEIDSNARHLLMEAVLEMMRSMQDGDGNIDHLTRSELQRYNQYMAIYNQL